MQQQLTNNIIKAISCLFLLFFSISEHSLYAFSKEYCFKHYTINNGLSQNTVYTIFQDRQGFMWFGTKDGLNRFDGNTFKTFRFPLDSDLSDSVFRRILQTPDQNLWVATDQGVYIYNPKKETFTRFSKQTDDHKSIAGRVSDMVADNDGDIWIAVEEKGVFHYTLRTGKLLFYPITQNKKGSLNLLTLCAGKNGDIWVLPYAQLFLRINKKTKSISKFSLPSAPQLLYQLGEVSAAVITPFNELILATSQKGVISINTLSGTYKTLLEKDNQGNTLFARALLPLNGNTLWIGTESGIYIYNTASGQYTNLKHDHAIAHSLSDNAIYSLYKDRHNGIWIGTYFGGVNYYPNLNAGFELFYTLTNTNSISGNRVREFCKASDNHLWIGTEDKGLNLFDPATRTFLPVPPALKNLYTNIHALYNDSDRYLWISTFSKGLNRYDLHSGKRTTYTQFDNPPTIVQNSVFALCKDNNNTLWIGTLSGINTFNTLTEQFTTIKQFDGIAVQDIKQLSDGNIYVATFHKGLFVYNPTTAQWQHFLHNPKDPHSLPYDKTTSLFEDSKKQIWITTEGAGFARFDPHKASFTPFNTLNGLANDVVYQIQEDNQGYLWLSTNGGIIRFNPAAQTFKNYTIHNGLKTNQFNYKSSYKDDNGTLYFGSVDGFVRFHPSTFEEINHNPTFAFTDFLVNNYPVSPTDTHSFLPQSIQYTQAITLPYDKSTIALQYALLDYTGINVKNIRYRLEGYDSQWHTPQHNTIQYTNLPYGTYRLLIAFADEDSPESTVIKSLTIQIERPFYRTWWAYLSYVLCAIALLAAVVYYMHRQGVKRQKQKMKRFEKDKEKELYASKIDFFTNIAHEIRTPLSLIKAPLENVLKEKNLPDEVVDNLIIMDKNTDRLLYLTNQLLDFRKTEANLYVLDLKVHNITSLVRETAARFTSFAEQQQMQLHLSLPEKELFAQVDKEAFTKIISNLLSNALKYGKTYAKVSLSYTDDTQNTFQFSLENDGALILNKYVKEIFKTFVQIDNQNPEKIVSGTGIGLALAKSLAELMKGRITYSNAAQTNLFTLTLPVGNLTEEVAEPPLSEKPRKKKSSERPTLLIVEDDLQMKNFLSSYLSKQYTTLGATNGKEALQRLATSAIDLIISDVMMPEMDGFALTEHIKSNLETSHIPIILLTAKVNNQSKIKGYEVGADAYIEKPFSTEVLNARIKALLQNRKHLQEAFIKNPQIGVMSIATTQSDKQFIQKLDTLIQEHLSDPDFNVEEIAGQFYMSRASFYRKIKGVLGLTPNEYIRIERLKKAALLLSEKKYKINEICYRVGFNSPSYFAKCFQQQFGVLPKAFLENE